MIRRKRHSVLTTRATWSRQNGVGCQDSGRGINRTYIELRCIQAGNSNLKMNVASENKAILQCHLCLWVGSPLHWISPNSTLWDYFIGPTEFHEKWKLIWKVLLHVPSGITPKAPHFFMLSNNSLSNNKQTATHMYYGNRLRFLLQAWGVICELWFECEVDLIVCKVLMSLAPPPFAPANGS